MPLVTADQIKADIETLQALSCQPIGSAVAARPLNGLLQWRIARDGYSPVFLSLTTGSVTQFGRPSKARGLKEALALLGLTLAP